VAWPFSVLANGGQKLSHCGMLRRLALFLLIASLPLRANLGDTIDQCVKRYGHPLTFSEASAKSPFGTVVFAAGGYTLVIFLLDTKEVGARVGKTDKSAFTTPELKNIMDADAPTPWTVAVSADPTCLRWEREDKATLLYDKANHVLIFTLPAMAEALKAKESPSPALTNAPPPRPPGVYAPAAPTTWQTSTNVAAPAPPANP
jgi:hypothetical protein